MPPPHGVILYWDSDVADRSNCMEESYLNSYLKDLNHVLNTLCHHCLAVAVGGPTLMGELPDGQNKKDSNFNYYRNITSAAIDAYNAETGKKKKCGEIVYIDTRSYYFANLPPNWTHTHGALTVDGEHPNEQGAHLDKVIFAEALNNFTVLWE